MTSHDADKSCVCKVCEKGFKTAQGLKGHMLIHTGDKPFKCKLCEKYFTQGIQNKYFDLYKMYHNILIL